VEVEIPYLEEVTTMNRVVQVYVWLAVSTASLVVAADQQINTQASQDQKDPAVTAGTGGRGLIVWSSIRQDGDSGGIFGRRMDPNHPVGPEFQVNASAAGNQAAPAVAMDDEGYFVVAWRGPWPQSDAEDIVARLFDPNGEPLTEDVHVNTYTTGGQVLPRVAGRGTGRFIVVWESETSPSANRPAIRGQLIDRSGRLVGPELAINDTAYSSRYPDVSVDSHGRFVVSWLEDRTANSVLARVFDPDGGAEGASFKVNSTAFKSVTWPSVAMNSQGTFVVAWDGHPEKASEDDIRARVFSGDGTSLTSEILVNTTQTGAQTNPRVAIDSSGEFLVVWEGPSADPNNTDVFGQNLDAAGHRIGEEARLNSFLAGNQSQPSVCLWDGGRFMAVWQSNLQDGSGLGIFADAGLRPVASASHPTEH
jgi:hypothetical protein